jgi:hypothetical protein
MALRRVPGWQALGYDS